MEKVSSGYYLYGESDHQTIMTFELEMVEKINAAVFEEAVNEALLVHPNLKVRLEWKENNFYFVENVHDFCITSNKKSVLIKDTCGYLFDIKIDNEIISFALSHALADGSAWIPFVKTCLLLYYYKMGRTEMLSYIEFRRKQYGDLSKYVVPYDLEILNEIELVKEPEKKNKYIFNKNHEGVIQKAVTFRIDLKKVESIIPIKNKMAFYFSIMHDSICENMTLDEFFSICVAVDMRRKLGIKKATHECFAGCSLMMNKNENMSFEEKIENYQQLWDESNVDAQSMLYYKKEVEAGKILQKKNLTYSVKKKMYKHMLDMQKAGQDSVFYSMLSFSNNKDILNDYIKCISVYGRDSVQDVLVEVEQVGDVDCFTISYCEEATAFVDNIKQKMATLEILIDAKQIVVENVMIDIEH